MLKTVAKANTLSPTVMATLLKARSKQKGQVGMNTDKFIISGGQVHGMEMVGGELGATTEFVEWLRAKANFSKVLAVW